MARLKTDATESPRNSRKNISLTLQNEENKKKNNSIIKKKKQCVSRSRKKEATDSPTIGALFQTIEEHESLSASASKKVGRKISTTKSPRNSKKKKLTERNTNVKDSNCDTTVKKRKMCVRKSSGIKEMTGSPSVVDPFQFIASPAVSSSKKPRKKAITTKSPRNSKKKNLLTERNVNESNEKCDCTVTTTKRCMCQRSEIREIASSSLVFSSLQLEEFASPTASSYKMPRRKILKTKSPRTWKVITTKSPHNLMKKKILAERNVSENNEKIDTTVKAPRRKVLKTKSPRISKKRKLPTEQKDHANNEKSENKMKKKKQCDLQLADREENVSLIVNISSSEDVTFSEEIASVGASSAEQKDHINNEETDSNMKKKKQCDLQLGDRDDSVSLIVNISSAEDVAFVKENVVSAAASSVEQKDHKINEKSDSNMNKMELDLQSGDRYDDKPFVGNISSTKDLALVKEIASTAASSTNSKSNYEEVREMRCCMICMELEQSCMLAVMSCGHSFHSLCLQTWFEVKKSCPLCNPEIPINDDAFSNHGIRGTDEFNDMNGNGTLSEYMKKYHNKFNLIDGVVNELKRNDLDINEFLMQCVICMGRSRSLPLGDSHDQFELMPCGHNVHTSCAQTSSGIQLACRVCMENSMTEGDSIYEFPEEVRCVICLDTVESSDFEYISCCHSFHRQCIQTWFTVRRGEICPVCMVSSNSNAVEDETLYGFLENVKCTICMDIEESSDFQRLSCRHSFHMMCAQTWFEENNYCPTCMRNVALDSTATDDEEEVRCVICVDTEESSVFEFLSCCHSFHAACIQSWFKKGKSCPICNTRILDTSNTIENIGCAAACS